MTDEPTMADYYDDGLPGDTDDSDERHETADTAGPSSPWEPCPVCCGLFPMTWRSHDCSEGSDQ
jgi:hypothetical protein